MNSSDLILRDLILGIFILVIILVGPAVAAVFLNRRHQSRHPNGHPYGWGYYLGFCGFLAPLLWGLTNGNFAGCFLAGAIIYYPFAILTLCRNRWGLLILTVLSINPIIWIINGFYISKRWNQMATKNPSLLPPPPPQIPQAKYFLHLEDQVKGPFSKEQIRALLTVGTATLDTQCCKEGTTDWHTLVGSGALRE